MKREQVVEIGNCVECITEAWVQVTKEDQGDMPRLMLDAVYVDMPTGKVIGLKPKFAFLPLFKPGGAIGGKRGALSYWRPQRAAKSPPPELQAE